MNSSAPEHVETLDAELFAQIADHTLLASGVTPSEIEVFLDDARELGVSRVCISPSRLPVDAHGLEIVTVVGFPSGEHHGAVKAAEAQHAVSSRADEIDMVVNLGHVHAHNWESVEGEVRAVRESCIGRVLKVILETAALSDEEIVGACRASQAGGADFVKTSTGFHPAGGASVHAVKLMAETVGGELGIKASGGVRTAAQVLELWNAGATRFGVSGTAAILAELASDSPADETSATTDDTSAPAAGSY